MGDLIVGCVVWGWRGGREKLPVTGETMENLGEEGGMTRTLEVVVPKLGPALGREGEMLRILWRKNSLKRVLFFHEKTGFTSTLLEKDPQNSNSDESSENRETFL